MACNPTPYCRYYLLAYPRVLIKQSQRPVKCALRNVCLVFEFIDLTHQFMQFLRVFASVIYLCIDGYSIKVKGLGCVRLVANNAIHGAWKFQVCANGSVLASDRW